MATRAQPCELLATARSKPLYYLDMATRAPLAALVRGVSAGFTKALARNPVPLDLARYPSCHFACSPSRVSSSNPQKTPTA